jgi:hypothetical protein
MKNIAFLIFCTLACVMPLCAHAQEVVMLCTQSTTSGTPPSCVPVSSTNPLPTSSH